MIALMGWFRRTARDDRPDPELGMLTVDQAARLRQLVRAEFAGRGIEVAVHAGHVADEDGGQYGLWNLAASCHAEPDGERAWPEAVRRHVTTMLAAMADEDPMERMDLDTLLRSVFVRLAEATPILTGPDFEHADEVAPGVLRLIVVDLPETVLTPRKPQLEARAPVGRLWDAGWRNLTAMLDDATLVVEPVGPPGESPSFHVVLGDSVYTASLVLLLPELLARLLPDHSIGEAGVLVGFPYRNQIAVHVVTDPELAVRALTRMPQFVAVGFGEAPGPISPHTYWWHDGQLEQLTRIAEDGTVQVHLDERIARAFGLVEPD